MTGDSKKLCLPDSPYQALKGGDCADNDASVNPGKAEIACNKKDDDCKGGDTCNTCPGSVCGGKCGQKTPAGKTPKRTCYYFLGVLLYCDPWVLHDCYCDASCLTFGDCCAGYQTCCK